MSRKNHRVVSLAAFSMVEQLEQRRLLSSSITTALVDNGDGTSTVKVTGTKNKDYIIVVDDPADPIIQIANDKNHNGNFDAGEQINEYASGDVNAVLIDSQQGDDTVKYELASSYEGTQRSIEVDLADGNDKFTFEGFELNANLAKPALPIPLPDFEIEDHSNINIEVDGQEKNDTIDVDFGDINIQNSEVLVNVDAGSGNDNVSLEAPFFGIIGSDDKGTDTSGGPSDYTQLQVQVDLGSGNNLFSDFFLTQIDYAQVTINVNGGSGKDTIQSEEFYSLNDDSDFSYTANLQGGNDYYNGEVGENEVEEGSEASYNLQGGDGNDRMTFEGGGEGETSTDGVTPAQSPDGGLEVDGIFQVNMYGGTGNDTMDMWNDDVITPTTKPNAKPQGVASSNSDPMAPMMFETGEDGSVRVVMSGDAGNDKVRLNLGATEDSEGDYDLSVLGASGKDTVAAGFDDETEDPDSQVTFGPSGAILLDGGRDTDTYEVVSTLDTPFDVRAVEILGNSLLPPLF